MAFCDHGCFLHNIHSSFFADLLMLSISEISAHVAERAKGIYFIKLLYHDSSPLFKV